MKNETSTEHIPPEHCWDPMEAVHAKLLEGGIEYTQSDGNLEPLIRMVKALADEGIELADYAQALDRRFLRFVFKCNRTGKGAAARWSFDCPYCDSKHTHSPEPGRRSSHCLMEPLRSNGYWLE